MHFTVRAIYETEVEAESIDDAVELIQSDIEEMEEEGTLASFMVVEVEQQEEEI